MGRRQEVALGWDRWQGDCHRVGLGCAEGLSCSPQHLTDGSLDSHWLFSALWFGAGMGGHTHHTAPLCGLGQCVCVT